MPVRFSSGRLSDLGEERAREHQPLPGPVRLLDDAQSFRLPGRDEDTHRESRRLRHQTSSATNRSASATRSSPEMSLGSSVSRIQARHRDCDLLLLVAPNNGPTRLANLSRTGFGGMTSGTDSM